MKTILFTCASLLILTACATMKKTKKMDQSSHTNQPTSEIGVAQIGKPAVSDMCTIQRAKLTGNILELTVSYSGGCEVHQFELIGNPNIAKSLPLSDPSSWCTNQMEMRAKQKWKKPFDLIFPTWLINKKRAA